MMHTLEALFRWCYLLRLSCGEATAITESMFAFSHVSVLTLTLGIFLVSAALQGASGFGMALLAVPLLTLVMEPKLAVPVTTMAGIVGSGMIVLRLWRHCDWRRAAWLGIPALVTAPFGVHLLKVLTAGQLCLGLGVILVGSAAVSLWAKMRARTPVVVEPLRNVRISPVGSVAVGGFSGVLGGALGMTGPLLADYLNKSGIHPDEFRITLNVVFLASSVWRTGLYVARDVFTGQTLWLGTVAIPATVAGILLGGVMGRWIQREAFATYINGLLLLIGIGLLVQAAMWPVQP